MTNGLSVPLLLYSPALTHSQSVRQDTPFPEPPAKSVLLGVVAKDQVAPFQTVANAPCTLTGLAALPTAAQVVMLKQSTPNSWLSSLVDVFGLVVIVQVDPFHDSTNVWNVPDASVPPTASQKAEPMHETPFRRARSAPVSVGFGLGMMV